MSAPIGIGIIGVGRAGIRHARACVQIPIWYGDSAINLNRVVCADVNAPLAKRVAARLGFATWADDWRLVIADPRVDAVAIATPNCDHLEIVEAAAHAGKHILCEKPLGISPAETAAAAKAVKAAGIVFMVGYNYRCVPAVAHAADMVASGEIGNVTHYRGRYFQDDGADVKAPMAWRYRRAEAGFGTLADLMTHAIDTAHFVIGPIASTVASQATFTTQRRLEGPPGEAGAMGTVENEDYVGALVRFANGARGSLEACRIIYGPTNENSFELNGSKGSIKWSLERMHEMQIHLSGEEDSGYARVLARAGHGDHGAFNPGAGNGPSLMDLKTIEFHRFLLAVLGRAKPSPDINDALAVARVQASMIRSWQSGRWEPVGPI